MTPTSSRGMFTVSVSYGPRQVLIAASGPAGVVEICGALSLGGEIARRARRDQFLIDLLAVDFEGSVQDREEMGRFAASMLGGVKRIAVVLWSGQTTGDGERAAQAAGLELRNFAALPDAMEWLES